MNIQFVPYQHINKVKWDGCISNSGNGLIYATSLYLDNMSENWDALVLDDYAAVMPLTWKKKYGICYLYQPYFTACLGIFGNTITAELVHDFLKAIPAKFKYWDISLNHGNVFPIPGFSLYERVNYVLPLNRSYGDIYAGFRDNIKRNIRKAEKLECVIETGFPVQDVIALAREQSKDFANIPVKDFERFTRLYQALHQKQQAVTYGVYTKTRELVASCVFFFYGNRACYILVGNHPNGKTIGASHALINAFIKDHAGKNILLDFEGSDIRNLAFFYSSFGAMEEKYAGLKYNKLPKLLWLIKK